MASVRWLPEALHDLTHAAAYIRQHDLAAADRYYERLIALAGSLCQFPHRGRPAADGCRELTGMPPYVLRYRVTDDQVEIVEVRHGRRQQRR